MRVVFYGKIFLHIANRENNFISICHRVGVIVASPRKFATAPEILTAVVEGLEQGGVFSFKLERIYDVKKIPGEYLGDDDEDIKKIYKRISCNQVTYDVLTGNPTLQIVVIAVKGKVNSDNTPGRVFAYDKIKEEKIHRTQTELSREEMERMGYADSIRELGNWGFFKFEVYDSDRIAYRLLQHHSNLKVIAPRRLQDRMRKISENLYKLYN